MLHRINTRSMWYTTIGFTSSRLVCWVNEYLRLLYLASGAGELVIWSFSFFPSCVVCVVNKSFEEAVAVFYVGILSRRMRGIKWLLLTCYRCIWGVTFIWIFGLGVLVGWVPMKGEREAEWVLSHKSHLLSPCNESYLFFSCYSFSSIPLQLYSAARRNPANHIRFLLSSLSWMPYFHRYRNLSPIRGWAGNHT